MRQIGYVEFSHSLPSPFCPIWAIAANVLPGHKERQERLKKCNGGLTPKEE
jgi:hypothetical protein